MTLKEENEKLKKKIELKILEKNLKILK